MEQVGSHELRIVGHGARPAGRLNGTVGLNRDSFAGGRQGRMLPVGQPGAYAVDDGELMRDLGAHTAHRRGGRFDVGRLDDVADGASSIGKGRDRD